MVDDTFRIAPGRARNGKDADADTGVPQVEQVSGQGRESRKGGRRNEPAGKPQKTNAGRAGQAGQKEAE